MLNDTAKVDCQVAIIRSLKLIKYGYQLFFDFDNEEYHKTIFLNLKLTCVFFRNDTINIKIKLFLEKKKNVFFSHFFIKNFFFSYTLFIFIYLLIVICQ